MISRTQIPIKTVRADNKFKLMYMVRKYEKLGWTRGRIENNPTDGNLICYMYWKK